jgi:hypothetical protein
LDSLSRMFANVNHGPDDLKRRARQLPAQGYPGPRRSLGTSLPCHAVQLGSRVPTSSSRE